LVSSDAIIVHNYGTNTEPSIVVHTCNPSTGKAEAGGLRVPDQSGLCRSKEGRREGEKKGEGMGREGREGRPVSTLPR
jgi:hypothetical protein